MTLELPLLYFQSAETDGTGLSTGQLVTTKNHDEMVFASQHTVRGTT